MPGQDVTGLPASLGSIQNLDGDKNQSAAEIEAKIAAMEEHEKSLSEDDAVLLNYIQNHLCQELERAGLGSEGEDDE